MGGDSPERGGIIGRDPLDVSPGNSPSLERFPAGSPAPPLFLCTPRPKQGPVNRICPPLKASRPIRTPSHYEADGLPSRSKMTLFDHTKLVVDQQDGPVPRPRSREAVDYAAVRAAPRRHYRGPPASRRSARPEPPAGWRARRVQAHGDHRVRPSGGRGLRRGARRRRQRGGIRVPGAAHGGKPRGCAPSKPQVRGLVSVLQAATVRLPIRSPARSPGPRAVPGCAVAPPGQRRRRRRKFTVWRPGREDQAAPGHRRLGGALAIGGGHRRHGRGHLRYPACHRPGDPDPARARRLRRGRGPWVCAGHPPVRGPRHERRWRTS